MCSSDLLEPRGAILKEAVDQVGVELAATPGTQHGKCAGDALDPAVYLGAQRHLEDARRQRDVRTAHPAGQPVVDAVLVRWTRRIVSNASPS